MADSNAPVPAGNLPATQAKKTEKHVVYTGPATRRVINANDWKKAGVEDQKQVVWDRTNGFSVPAGDLNEKALNYVDKVDDGFKVEEREL